MVENKLTSLKDQKIIIKGEFCCFQNNLTIKGLQNIEIDVNVIYLLINKELGNIQYIRNFNELKEEVEKIFNIEKEKNNLLNTINKKNKKKNTINKI